MLRDGQSSTAPANGELSQVAIPLSRRGGDAGDIEWHGGPMMTSKPWASLVALVLLAACDGGKPGDSTAQSASASSSAAKSASAAPTSSAQAQASASPSEAPSGTPSAAPTTSTASTPPAPAGPLPLAQLFDGAPDASVKMSGTKTYERATISLPEGWKEGGAWQSVYALESGDGLARLVILQLAVNEAYLDMNVDTWTKVPFVNPTIKWSPREPGKVFGAHLDAKLASGTGTMKGGDAEFWQLATALKEKSYDLVVIAGWKKDAAPERRSELIAAVRSIQWK
jgi:hypothetical protein